MSSDSKWQRGLLAGFAVLFLVLGVLIQNTDYLQSGSQELFSGTLLKVGFVLGLAWIAAPQLEQIGWERLRGTMLAGVVIVVILMCIRPKIGALAASILAASCMLVMVTGWIRKVTRLSR